MVNFDETVGNSSLCHGGDGFALPTVEWDDDRRQQDSCGYTIRRRITVVVLRLPKIIGWATQLTRVLDDPCPPVIRGAQGRMVRLSEPFIFVRDSLTYCYRCSAEDSLYARALPNGI